MIRRTVLLIALAAVAGATLPQNAAANYDCADRAYHRSDPNSITVYNKDDNEGTFTVDSRTRFTRSGPPRGGGRTSVDRYAAAQLRFATARYRPSCGHSCGTRREDCRALGAGGD